MSLCLFIRFTYQGQRLTNGKGNSPYYRNKPENKQPNLSPGVCCCVIRNPLLLLDPQTPLPPFDGRKSTDSTPNRRNDPAQCVRNLFINRPSQSNQRNTDDQGADGPAPKHLNQHAAEARRRIEPRQRRLAVHLPATPIAARNILHDAERQGRVHVADDMRAQAVPPQAPAKVVRDARVDHVDGDHDHADGHDDTQAPDHGRVGDAEADHEGGHDEVGLAEDEVGAVKVPAAGALEGAVGVFLLGEAQAAEAVLAAGDEAEHGGDDGEHGARAHVGQVGDGEVEDERDEGAFG